MPRENRREKEWGGGWYKHEPTGQQDNLKFAEKEKKPERRGMNRDWEIKVLQNGEGKSS